MMGKRAAVESKLQESSQDFCMKNNLANIQRSLAPFIIILFIASVCILFLLRLIHIMALYYGAAFYKCGKQNYILI